MRRSLSILLVLGALGCAPPSGGVQIEGAEVRIAPVGAVTAAAYFTLRNGGVAADTLVSLGSDIADSLSLHESMDHGDGVIMMTPLTWLAIPAGESMTFAQGGRHVMLERFKRPIAPGDSIWLSLHFSSGHRVEVIVPVRAVGGEE